MQRQWIPLIGFWLNSAFGTPEQGMAQGILPLGVHGEAPRQGWGMGQGSWPATPPYDTLRWTLALGGRHHPWIASLNELSLHLGRRWNQDWLTFNGSRQGHSSFRHLRLQVGLSKAIHRSRLGLNLGLQAIRSVQKQSHRLTYCVGMEQNILPKVRCGIRLEHKIHGALGDRASLPEAQGAVNPLTAGLFLWREHNPWTLGGSVQFDRLSGIRMEAGAAYQWREKWGASLAVDPLNALLTVGLRVGWGRTVAWLSGWKGGWPGLAGQFAWEGGLP